MPIQQTNCQDQLLCVPPTKTFLSAWERSVLRDLADGQSRRRCEGSLGPKRHRPKAFIVKSPQSRPDASEPNIRPLGEGYAETQSGCDLGPLAGTLIVDN